jgi:hypothetical protein
MKWQGTHWGKYFRDETLGLLNAENWGEGEKKAS